MRPTSKAITSAAPSRERDFCLDENPHDRTKQVTQEKGEDDAGGVASAENRSYKKSPARRARSWRRSGHRTAGAAVHACAPVASRQCSSLSRSDPLLRSAIFPVRFPLWMNRLRVDFTRPRTKRFTEVKTACDRFRLSRVRLKADFQKAMVDESVDCAVELLPCRLLPYAHFLRTRLTTRDFSRPRD